MTPEYKVVAVDFEKILRILFMQTNNYEGLQINTGTTKKVEDSLVVEAALQININTEPYTVVMRTPDHDDLNLFEDYCMQKIFTKTKRN